MRGRVFVFGDEVNTDMIINRRHYRGDKPISQTVQHVFETIRPDFVEEVEDGDIVVGGEHFGAGSARPAPDFIRATGIDAVVAESYSRTYYRNSMAVGMPAIIAPGISDHVTDGDEVEIKEKENVLVNHSTGSTHPVEPIPDLFQKISEAGDLLTYFKENPKGLAD